MTDKPAMNIGPIIAMQEAERNAFGEVLMKALRENMPWGLKVDLGNGQTAELVPMNGNPKASQPTRQPIYEDGVPLAIKPGEEPTPVGFRPWSFSFDWQLKNCDADHVEITVMITGGGGLA